MHIGGIYETFKKEEGMTEGLAAEINALINCREVIEKSSTLLEHYKNKAVRAMKPLDDSELKRLLHRITGKIFRG